MITIIFILLLFAGRSHSGLIRSENSSSFFSSLAEFNETDVSPPLVIYNSNNETSPSQNQSLVIDKNQFAETVVDLLLDLLEKANLSRTVSVIHNETELTELVEQDDLSKRTSTVSIQP